MPYYSNNSPVKKNGNDGWSSPAAGVVKFVSLLLALFKTSSLGRVRLVRVNVMGTASMEHEGSH